MAAAAPAIYIERPPPAPAGAGAAAGAVPIGPEDYAEFALDADDLVYESSSSASTERLEDVDRLWGLEFEVAELGGGA